MTYKTILVNCAGERRLGGLLGPAVDLSRRFEAHLTGLAVLPPVIVDPALTPGGTATIVDSHRKAYEIERRRMKEVFEDAIRAAGVVGEWLTDDTERGSVWRRVVDYGCCADLIVSSQSDPDWAYSQLMEAPSELVLHSGRPVLLVPNTGNHVGIGRRVLVAWNGEREAARAAHDALPLLTTAEKVWVAWINPNDNASAEDLPGADLCTALARHGVRCEAVSVDRPDHQVGEALLTRARQTSADLIVMGCYGHTRLRELVLGGATRHVLRHMSVPVLMAH